jgi:Na+-transporting NADH:ubiquinone oxidoreductase subunit NqrB
MQPPASLAPELAPPAPRAVPPPPGGPLEVLWRVPAKWLIALLITLILVVGHLGLEILASLWVLPATLGTAVACELFLSQLVRGSFGSIQSAYISGISMSILAKPQQGLMWPFVLGAALSIASKYTLTRRGRHLWNPTNFGVSALLLLAPDSVAILSTQFDNSLMPLLVIWSVGVLVAARARILHVTFSYLVAFLVLTAGRAALTGESFLGEVAPLTGPMYQLFLLFMITDPPTTVSSRRGRILVAVLIAVVEAGIRLLDELPSETLLHPLLQAPPIFALAIVGPIAKFIDIELQARRARS